MRHLVSRSDGVQSLESVSSLGCAGLDVETTPSDALVETSKVMSVCDKCHALVVRSLRVFELRLLLDTQYPVALAVEGVHEPVCVLPPLRCRGFGVPQGPP
jgi:hypothetical protein